MSSSPESDSSVPDWHTEPPYAPSDPSSPREPKYRGACHCRSVTFSLFSDPLSTQFCHCNDCQKLHGSPAHWSAVYDKPDVLFTCPPDNILFYRTEDNRTVRELPAKLSCARCHSPVADEGRKKVLIFPALIDFASKEERTPFLPGRHVFYKMRAMDVHDGKPKFEEMQNESPLMDEEGEHGKEGVTGTSQKKRKVEESE